MRLGEFKKMRIVATVVSVAIVTISIFLLVAPTHEEPATQDALPSMRLLSQGQYKKTVAAIFGDHIVTNVRFSPVQRIDGLVAIGARPNVMTIGGLEPLDNSARMIAR